MDDTLCTQTILLECCLNRGCVGRHLSGTELRLKSLYANVCSLQSTRDSGHFLTLRELQLQQLLHAFL